jgi:hypothetical protein
MTAMIPVTSVPYGNVVRLATSEPFTDFDGNAVDPDEVLIGFIINGGTPVVFKYDRSLPTPDPTSTITRSSTGMYYATINTSTYTSGLWSCSILGRPNLSSLDTTHTAARANWEFVVDAAPFSLGS